MQSIKLWIMSIAVGAIVGAVAIALAPSDTLGKAIKTAVSIFLISAMLMPVFNKSYADFRLEIQQSEKSEYVEASIINSVSSSTADAIKNKILDFLNAYGIYNAQVDIKMKTDKSQISVDSVEVRVPDEYYSQKSEIKNMIKNELEINAEISIKNDWQENDRGS